MSAYESGKSITVTNSDGTKVTYVLKPDVQAPPDLVTGKMVTIMVMPSGDSTTRPLVKKTTYKVEKKEEK